MGLNSALSRLDRVQPSFKNKIINGGFDINQRAYISGTATISSNQYTLDRWRVVTLGESLLFAQVNGIVTITAPLGGVEQVIEPLYIGTYTLSFNGTATAEISESVDNVTYTPILPNADGSYTTTGYNYIKVKLSSGTASFIQLEEGSVATAFEQVDVGIQLLRCQRYFELCDGQEYRAFAVSSITHLMKGSYKVQKRVVPTIILLTGVFNTIDGNTVNGWSIGAVGVSSGAAVWSVTLSSDAEL